MVSIYHLYHQSYWEQEKDNKQSTFLSAAGRSTVCASIKDSISRNLFFCVYVWSVSRETYVQCLCFSDFLAQKMKLAVVSWVELAKIIKLCLPGFMPKRPFFFQPVSVKLWQFQKVSGLFFETGLKLLIVSTKEFKIELPFVKRIFLT